LIGDQMDIAEDNTGQEADASAVAIHDLDLRTAASRPSADRLRAN
jgi:hypothetical protein